VRTTTVVIGAGQAGLAMSRCLSECSIDHVVLERREIANSWRTERWDSLRLLTPNWQCRLPGYSYKGDDPDGFMTMPEVVDFITDYATLIAAPVKSGVPVSSVRRSNGEYRVTTNQGEWRCETVVVATGAFNVPHVPPFSDAVPSSVATLTPLEYRNPEQLGEGFRRRSLRLPAAIGFRDIRALEKLPRRPRRRLAPGVIELDAHRHVREVANVGNQLRQRGLVGVGIEAEALRGNTPLRAHRCRLENCEARARQREGAGVLPVPRRGRAIDRAVLAQRRNHNPVFQREIAQMDGREELRGHGRSLTRSRRSLPSAPANATSHHPARMP